MGFFDPFGGNTSGSESGGSNISIDTTLTQSGKAADAKVTGDKIKKIETDGIATINEVKIVGELDSVDDLKIAGKVFEVEDKDSTGEVFNDYENNIANGPYSHAEGTYYYTGTGASIRTIAGDAGCHAEGVGCQALHGQGGHAEGVGTRVQYGNGNHSEGYLNEIYYGTGCHVEGYKTSILGKGSSNCRGNHIEGISTNKAIDIIGSDFDPSLTYNEMKTKWDDNKFSLSFGEGSHVEGQDCVGFGDYSHAEGKETIATGYGSHAEGRETNAQGEGAHSEGYSTIASSDYQHVQGKYNVEDSDDKYAFIIGNGTDGSRSNAFAIDWNGNIYVNNSSTGVNLNTIVSDIANRYTKSQTYTKTETDNAIKTKIAEVIANAPEDLDTLKEIADWIDTHSDSASAMNTAIKANTEAIQNLKTTSKAKLEYVTLSYLDWSNNEITVYSESIAEDSIITLNPGPSITEEQYSALSAARIIASEQGEGYIKLRALGEVTQYVDIPISILIQGNIIEAETNTITDSVTGEKYRFKISNGVMELEKI